MTPLKPSKEGAYDYLPKPLDNNALLQKIRTAISERRDFNQERLSQEGNLT